jgi:hypothetical protein
MYVSEWRINACDMTDLQNINISHNPIPLLIIFAGIKFGGWAKNCHCNNSGGIKI